MHQTQTPGDRSVQFNYLCKQSAHWSEKPYSESLQVLITSVGEMFLELGIPVTIVATEHGFKLHYTQAGVQFSSMRSVKATTDEIFI